MARHPAIPGEVPLRAWSAPLPDAAWRGKGVSAFVALRRAPRSPKPIAMKTTRPPPLMPRASDRARARAPVAAAPQPRRVTPRTVQRPAGLRWRLRWRLLRRSWIKPLAVLRLRLTQHAMASSAVIALALCEWLHALLLAGTLFLSARRGVHPRGRVPLARHPRHPPKPGEREGRPLGNWRRSAMTARRGGAYLPSYPFACSKKTADACSAASTPQCDRYERVAAHMASAGRYCRLLFSQANGTAPPDRAPSRAARPRAASPYQSG